ncbi:MAG TPA: hypothetical protein VK659_15330 [Asanoa sp.]|nr:hypothetical protein [Asanoa sp.]
MSEPTYGISIGRDNHGAVAAGDHAQAVQTTAAPPACQLDAIVRELTKVRAAIEGADEVVDRAKALRDVDALAAEVRQGDPDTDALRSTFAPPGQPGQAGRGRRDRGLPGVVSGRVHARGDTAVRPDYLDSAGWMID